MRAQDGPLILEVGCGSGAITLSLLSQLPKVGCLCIPLPCLEPLRWSLLVFCPPHPSVRSIEGKWPYKEDVPSPAWSQPLTSILLRLARV